MFNISLDGFILLNIEKYITHPLQRNFTWTNYTLSKPFLMALAIWMSIKLVEMIVELGYLSSPLGVIIICGFGYGIILLVTSVFLLTHIEAHALKRVEQGVANKYKASLIAQLQRLVCLMLIPSVGHATDESYWSVLCFLIYSILTLWSLDPLPRSKEDVPVPRGTVAAEVPIDED